MDLGNKEEFFTAVGNHGWSLVFASAGSTGENLWFSKELRDDEYFLGEILDKDGEMYKYIFDYSHSSMRISAQRVSKKELEKDENYLLSYAPNYVKPAKRK